MTYLNDVINNLIEQNATTREDFRRVVADIYKTHKVSGYHTNITLRDEYLAMVKRGEIKKNPNLEKLLITKKMRSLSGVSVISVLTKPYPCPGKCIFCPSQEDVPKSYLADEPAVMRAILNEYNPFRQVKTRLASLAKQGHPVDKVELIVIGGTFSFLPKKYQEEFIKGCLDALNGFVAVDLDEAKKANEKAKSKCVGLTLETRQDYINEEEIAWFRTLGATRVELGVQTVFDDILRKNERGHSVSETIRATKLLKDAGFKITYHLMPNLYGSNIEKDKEMFRQVFENENFKPDYIKIYPCMVTTGTKLEELYKKGEYASYSDEELVELISYAKSIVPYWIRIMRTIRDIPAGNIVSGSITSNLRQVVLEINKKNGIVCKCIRCREVGDVDSGRKPELFTENYKASDGQEFFLSYETKDRKLFSLLRLRLPECHSERSEGAHKTGGDFSTTPQNDIVVVLPELKGAALIREVHTYGQEAEVGEKGETQHRGLGKKLILEAERIAKENEYTKIAVISGVGVRDYYRKFGYELEGEYMVKNL